MKFNTENYIRYLFKNLNILVLTSIFFGVLSGIYIYYSDIIYKSSITFYISSSEEINPTAILSKNVASINLAQTEMNRLQSLAHSDDIINKLIDNYSFKLDLGFTKNSEVERKKIFSNLKNSFLVEVNSLREILVTVSNKDKNLALKIAKAIMNELNSLNNKFIIDFKKDKISIAEIKLKQAKLELSKFKKKHKVINKLLLSQQNSLHMQVNKFSNIISDEEFSIELLNNKKAYLINEFIPDDENRIKKAGIYFISTFIYSLFLFIVLIGLKLRYAPVFERALKK